MNLLSDAELSELEHRLDALPAPLEPLELSSLDGYLAGVLLQPQPVPAARWLAHVHDVDARPAPPGVDLARLHALVLRRHAELQAAIQGRRWFDPLVHELDEDALPSEAVMPWVAGFAMAMDLFPGLMRLDAAATLEPLAALYAHLDPEDLEDADELLAEIDTLEPPADLAAAVESLVSSTLLLADVSLPRASPPGRPPRKPGGAARPGGRGGRPRR